MPNEIIRDEVEELLEGAARIRIWEEARDALAEQAFRAAAQNNLRVAALPNVGIHLEKIPAPAKKPAVRKEGTVAGWYGIPMLNSEKALFGVEVEVEGEMLPREIKGFDTKEDGSLRGESHEYVFTKPLSEDGTLKALKVFSNAFKESVLDMSFRTSVHVHINMSNKTKEELCTFLYLAFLLENALVNYGGEGRIGNRFCLRVQDAEGKVEELYHLFANQGMDVFDQGRVKYSAINLACLRKFGSIEFRSMRGTTDYSTLSVWIQVLNDLFEEAKLYKTPLEVAEAYQKLGGLELAKKVFKKNFKHLDYPSLEDDMRRNYSLLIQLPYEFGVKEKRQPEQF